MLLSGPAVFFVGEDALAMSSFVSMDMLVRCWAARTRRSLR